MLNKIITEGLRRTSPGSYLCVPSAAGFHGWLLTLPCSSPLAVVGKFLWQAVSVPDSLATFLHNSHPCPTSFYSVGLLLRSPGCSCYPWLAGWLWPRPWWEVPWHTADAGGEAGLVGRSRSALWYSCLALCPSVHCQWAAASSLSSGRYYFF